LPVSGAEQLKICEKKDISKKHVLI